jgi:hypothetical protein
VFVRARYLAILTLNQVLRLLVVEFYRITYSPSPPLGALRNRLGHLPYVSGCESKAGQARKSVWRMITPSTATAPSSLSVAMESFPASTSDKRRRHWSRVRRLKGFANPGVLVKVGESSVLRSAGEQVGVADGRAALALSPLTCFA